MKIEMYIWLMYRVYIPENMRNLWIIISIYCVKFYMINLKYPDQV